MWWWVVQGVITQRETVRYVMGIIITSAFDAYYFKLYSYVYNDILRGTTPVFSQEGGSPLHPP